MSGNDNFANVIALIGKNGLPVSDEATAATLEEEVYEVVVSAGIEDGVELEMRFIIFEEGEELFDPTTRESLGRFEIVKGRGRVVHVQNKMCRLRSTATRKVLDTNYMTLSMVGRKAPDSNQYKTIALPLKGVKIGDVVRPI